MTVPKSQRPGQALPTGGVVPRKPRKPNPLSAFPKPGTALPTGGVVPVRAKGFTPYVVPKVAPPGTYDPQFDTQGLTQEDEYNAATGQAWVTGSRNLEDYNQAIAENARQLGLSLSGIQTASDRAAAQQQVNTQDLNTRYQRLGTSQTQSANAAGVGSGGALVAAQQARQGNQATDQSKLNTAYYQRQQDLNTQRDQTNAAAWINAAKLGQSYDRSAGDLLRTQATRDDEYNRIYQPGLETEKVYAAQQAGMLPQAPSNAHISNGTEDYATVKNTFNGIIYHKYPDGRLVPVGKTKPTTTHPAKK